MQLVYRVTLVTTLDNMSCTQLMGIDVRVTAIEVRDPTQGPGTTAGVTGPTGSSLCLWFSVRSFFVRSCSGTQHLEFGT